MSNPSPLVQSILQHISDSAGKRNRFHQPNHTFTMELSVTPTPQVINLLQLLLDNIHTIKEVHNPDDPTIKYPIDVDPDFLLSTIAISVTKHKNTPDDIHIHFTLNNKEYPNFGDKACVTIIVSNSTDEFPDYSVICEHLPRPHPETGTDYLLGYDAIITEQTKDGSVKQFYLEQFHDNIIKYGIADDALADALTRLCSLKETNG